MKGSARFAWTSALPFAFLLARAAHATDVSNELSAGALSSSSSRGNFPFLSDRLGASVDVNEALSFSGDLTYTRYFHSRGAPAENIFQLVAASDYMPDDHLSFGIDVRGSPTSTASTTDPTTGTGYKYKSASLGGGLSAEYDTAGDSDLETIADAYVGLTGYRTTQRPRSKTEAPNGMDGMDRTLASLLQWRASLGVTEQLFRSTEVGLTGTYYIYSEDPANRGYDGVSIWAREGVTEGMPLEPLRWAIRPSVRHKFGPLKLGAYVHYGRYVDDDGYMIVAALKGQLKVSEAVRLWVQVGFQRDSAYGEILSIPWGSVGARVML
jgi:hypothetical protein